MVIIDDSPATVPGLRTFLEDRGCEGFCASSASEGLELIRRFHSQKMLDAARGQSLPEPEGYMEKPPEPDKLLEEIGRVLGTVSS